MLRLPGPQQRHGAVAVAHALLGKRFFALTYRKGAKEALSGGEHWLNLVFYVLLAFAIVFAIRAGGVIPVFAFLIVPWIISIVDAVKVARVQLTLESGSGPAGYLPAYVPETLDVQLARIAAQRGGEVTVAEGALATGRSFDEVEAALDKMMHDGHVDIGNRPDTGVIVYRFL